MTNEPRWNARELKSELNRYEEELRAAGKTRNTINTYVQHPERFINWLVGPVRQRKAMTAVRPTRGGCPGGPRGTIRSRGISPNVLTR
jgi:hypothetical protein